jgi:hypothetical protein
VRACVASGCCSATQIRGFLLQRVLAVQVLHDAAKRQRALRCEDDDSIVGELDSTGAGPRTPHVSQRRQAPGMSAAAECVAAGTCRITLGVVCVPALPLGCGGVGHAYRGVHAHVDGSGHRQRAALFISG